MLIVFDLDGTLVDSLRDLTASTNELLAGYGLAPLAEEDVAQMVGDGARVLVRRALASRELEPAPADALSRFKAIYDRRLLDHTRPYPGVVEALERLSGMARLGVLTNKPAGPTREVLDGLALSHFFEAVVCDDGAVPRKPAPDGLRHLMERMGTAPAMTLLVGDSPIDLETARSAGTRICLVRYGFGFAKVAVQKLDGTELFVDSLQELVPLLALER